MDEKKTRLRKSDPKIVYKNQQSFRHDLFKLLETNVKSNKSWKKGIVQIEEFGHVHFFHTYDSSGRAQQYSTPSAGHFHEVKWHVDEDGNMKAICGPAMQYKYVKRAGRQAKKLTKITWEDEQNERVIEDNHVHEIEYRWSEELSKDAIERRRNAMTQQAGQQMQMAAMAQRVGLEGVE